MADAKRRQLHTHTDPALFKLMHQQIERMVNQIMPPIPHLISVPTKYPYRPEFPHENINTPFAPWEVKQLQYMTLVPFAGRGVAEVRGDWEDEFSGQSPNSSLRSGTTTPHSQRDSHKPRVKLSLADYKSGKRPPKTLHSTRDAVNCASDDKPDRPRESGDEMKGFHGLPRKPDLGSKSHRPPSPTSKPKQASNGYPPHRERADERRDVSPRRSPKPTHGYGKSHDSAKLKRPLGDVNTPPEKRSRLEVNGIRHTKSADLLRGPTSKAHTPRTSLSSRSPDPDVRSEPRKPNASRPSKLNMSTARGDGVLPPLLSPLPAGLTSPEERNGFDVPVKSKPKPKEQAPSRSPKPKSLNLKKRQDSPDILSIPPLLSPSLPDLIEQELARIKSSSVSSPSPGETAPKARREPSPTRKTDKGGKKPREEAVQRSAATAERPRSLVVKLKYKRRQARDIERILKMTSRKSIHPAEPHDAPVKKRSRPSDDTPEPSMKHPRNSESVDLDTRRPVTPAFKSPSGSAAQKSTPKKDVAAKSVAMRKVDSSDSHVRTPQTVTPTPVAHDKERMARSHSEREASRNPEPVEDLRALFNKYNELGTKLKREMDRLLQLKVRQQHPPTDGDIALGACVAIESITSYMVAFHAHDTMRAADHRPNDGSLWTGLFVLLDFVVEKCRQFKTLHVLALGVAATCREELERVYVTGADARSFDAFARNAKARDATWRDFRAAGRKYKLLGDTDQLALEPAAKPFLMFGPWASVTDTAGLVAKVLARWAMQEGIDWRKKIEF